VDSVRPRTADFRFDLERMCVLAAADGSTAVVIAPWASTGFHEGGEPFDRPGRATLVFHIGPRGWCCVHSHMSLNRGVPQASCGRPVQAR
jgi:ketosteroid isomerase-like protein